MFPQSFPQPRSTVAVSLAGPVEEASPGWSYHHLLYAFVFLGGNLFDLYNRYMGGQKESQFIDAIKC